MEYYEDYGFDEDLEDNMATCYTNGCVNQVSMNRYYAGYNTCLDCGDKQAKAVKHTIVPMHKSNYIVVTNPSDLVGINNKGGSVK